MMNRHVPRIALLLAILFALTILVLPAASHAEPQRSGTKLSSHSANSNRPAAEFMIVNKSDWDIHELYLSKTHKDTWGPDQLGDNIIRHDGGSFTLHSIPCGHYDIKVVDEDGDDCIIEDIYMCKDHTHWDLTNGDLAKCEGWDG